MLQELKKYENLGTPKYFYELVSILKESSKAWAEGEIDQLFYNRIIDGRGIFDGCVFVGLNIGILVRNFENKLIVADAIVDYLNSEKQFHDKFVEYLLNSLKENEDFHNIFSSQHISYDVVYRTIQINNSAFTFKFSRLKQLFIDFEILRVHPTPEFRKYIFNSRYKKIFDKFILPEIKKRKVGIEELKQDLEQKQIYGEEAELFVLAFEKTRLANKKGIDWVAEYSVAEGYDILSFNTISSTKNDRCIEVKSYTGSPYFFWSRNEMDIARIKGDEYYLYLVDRSQINNENYTPIIIQNPYHNVLNGSDWIKTVDKYKIELNKDF